MRREKRKEVDYSRLPELKDWNHRGFEFFDVYVYGTSAGGAFQVRLYNYETCQMIDVKALSVYTEWDIKEFLTKEIDKCLKVQNETEV